MQSALDTEMVLDVRRELEAIIEAAPADGYDEAVATARAAISSLDDALRDPADAGTHIEDATAYVVDLKHRLHDGPFDTYVRRADEMLTALA